MRSEHDTTLAVRSWLEDGVTAMPDRVLDAVLDQLPATRQRRSFWPRLGLGDLRLPKLAAAAAAAAAVALLVVVTVVPVLVPGHPASPTPGPTPSPASSPSPTPVLVTRTLSDFPVGISFRAPEDWANCELGRLEQGVCEPALNGIAVAFIIVDRVPNDPCNPEAGLVDLPPAPTVDDLVLAITNLPGFTTTTTVREIALDGFSGKEFTIIAPRPGGCELQPWGNAERMNGVGAGERNLIRIVDVDGTRVVLAGAYFQEHDAEDIAVLEAIMDSVDFEI